MLNVTQSFDVKAIDADTASVIKKAVQDVQPSADGTKAIGLNLESASGKISDAITLLEGIHKSDVDYTTSGSGDLGLAAIILLAGAKPGERTVNKTATFNFRGVAKKAGKKGKTLNDTGKFALEILTTFTGRKSNKIKSFMLSGAKVTASEMKALGLIDKTEGGFVDKYEQFRKVTKKGK
jgi:ATP-dependent protease ClpP protease subunit